MTDSVAQNVTISSNAAAVLTISGLGTLGTGILIDNTNAFTLTITARIGVDASQVWTNNSGNLFTVSGNVTLSGKNLTVNGTGDTLISGHIVGAGMGSILTKDGSGTLTLTGTLTTGGNRTVNGGTLLMNGSSNNHTWTANNSGTTLGGTGTIGGPVVVNAGANLAPGNGGNTTAILQTGTLTLAANSNFRVDINGTAVGTGYDQIHMNTGATTITGSNLVVTVGTTLSVGQTFTILNKVSGGAIVGTFAQGSTVTGSDGTVFSVSYTGGNGNDIVLTVVQVAASPSRAHVIGGALAIAGLAFTQRRRLGKW
jgi:autotransporter-associated beta strand protein